MTKASLLLYIIILHHDSYSISPLRISIVHIQSCVCFNQDWRLEKKSSDVFVPDQDDARSSRFSSSTSDTNVDEEAPMMASSRVSYIGRSQLSSRDA